jgi:hypothetical protein
MKILVNGGSPSRGPRSWPYLIQQYLNSDLVNLSLSGSGNNYIHETTIAEIAQRSYNLVLIQWSPFIRFDFKVKDIETFSDTIYTSLHQSAQNDWPEKIVEPINDQDYIEKNWIFGCGVAFNSDPDPSLNKAFEGFYKYSGASEQIYHAAMKIISLQSFLQVKKIPYLFVFARPFRIPDRYRHLRNLINWTNVYTDYAILELMEQRNSRDPDGIHPSTEVYQEFAKLILPRINQIIND